MEDNLRPPGFRPSFSSFFFFSLPTSVTRAHARRRARIERNGKRNSTGCRVIYDSSFRLDGSRRIRPRNSDEFLVGRPSSTRVPTIYRRNTRIIESNAVSSHVDGKFYSERGQTNGKRTSHEMENISRIRPPEFSVSGQKRREGEGERWFSTMVENDPARPAIVTKTRAAREQARGTNFTPKNARIKDKGREISRVKAA